jgi:AraC-like DNA-binding protein
MHTLRWRPPIQALRQFVRVYAEREIKDTAQLLQEPVPARLEQTIEFQIGEKFEVIFSAGKRRWTPGVVSIGPHIDGGVSILLRKNVHTFAIFFQPQGVSRLFAIPMARLSYQAPDAQEVCGEHILRLHQQLSECRSFEERVRLTEAFLLTRATVTQDNFEDPMEQAALRIFTVHGIISMNQAAADCAVGIRQFQRRFRDRTGFSPKLFARVARFQHALDAKIARSGRHWADIAQDLGYHDQMHMLRDFRLLANATPGEIFRSIGDCRPPALAELSRPSCRIFTI